MGTGSRADTREVAQAADRSAHAGARPGGAGKSRSGSVDHPGGRLDGRGPGRRKGRTSGSGKAKAGRTGKGKLEQTGKGLAGAVVGSSGKAASAGDKVGDAAGRAVRKGWRSRPPVTPGGARRRFNRRMAGRAKRVADRGLNSATDTVGQLGSRAQQAGAAAGAKGDKGKPEALDPVSTSKVAGGGAAATAGGKAAGATARSAVLATRAGRTGLRVAKRTLKVIYKLIPLPPYVKAIVVLVIVLVMALVIFIIAVLDGLDQENADSFDDRNLAELYGLGGTPGVDDVVAHTDIPREAADAYLSAAETYDVDWWVLAGVGYVECTNGTYEGQGCNPDITVAEARSVDGEVRVCEEDPPGDHPAPNTKGARGPMQMTGNTWSGEHCQGDVDVAREPIPDGEENDGSGYASDGDGDGVADPWSFTDAAHGTARLLLHRGDGDIWHGVHRYNPGAGTSAQDSWYVDDVREAAEGYRDAVPTMPSINPVTNGPFTGECPPQAPQAAPVQQDSAGVTDTMQGVVDAVQTCFGGPPGGGGNCFNPRNGSGEHPRRRACDLMVCGGCAPARGTLQFDWGETVALWLIANHEELGVSLVIWNDRIWSPTSDSGLDLVSPYNGCCDNTQRHHDHVHVSVWYRPGEDPSDASCSAPGAWACYGDPTQ